MDGWTAERWAPLLAGHVSLEEVDLTKSHKLRGVTPWRIPVEDRVLFDIGLRSMGALRLPLPPGHWYPPHAPLHVHACQPHRRADDVCLVLFR